MCLRVSTFQPGPSHMRKCGFSATSAIAIPPREKRLYSNFDTHALTVPVTGIITLKLQLYRLLCLVHQHWNFGGLKMGKSQSVKKPPGRESMDRNACQHALKVLVKVSKHYLLLKGLSRPIGGIVENVRNRTSNGTSSVFFVCFSSDDPKTRFQNILAPELCRQFH